jgi:hypothetical protein
MRNPVDLLPPYVRVGPYEFRLERWKLIEAAAASRWGECSSASLTIRVQEEFPHPIKAVDTVLHEIMHAVFWTYGIQDSDDHERTVGALGTALTALHRDNPWLAGWITAALAAH